MEEQPRTRRVGILGYGQLGQFLVSQLLSRGPSVGLSLAFVWARRWEALEALPPALRLRELSDLPGTGVDLVVEVAHPCVTQEHGEDILGHADLMLGSPTVLADAVTEGRLRAAAARGGHTLYVPRGALWGCEDIARMDSAGTLQCPRLSHHRRRGHRRRRARPLADRHQHPPQPRRARPRHRQRHPPQLLEQRAGLHGTRRLRQALLRRNGGKKKNPRGTTWGRLGDILGTIWGQ
ncbi:aspartate dehydrogenase domain-containing protein isoform 1-T1 [Passerculus sandwichensis]